MLEDKDIKTLNIIVFHMLKRLNGVMEETERLKIEVLEVKGTVPNMKNTLHVTAY